MVHSPAQLSVQDRTSYLTISIRETKRRLAAEQHRSCRSIWNRLTWILSTVCSKQCLVFMPKECVWRGETGVTTCSKYLKCSSASSVVDRRCDGHEKTHAVSDQVPILINILHWAVTKICYGKTIRAREAGCETSPCNSHPASINLQLSDLLSQRWYLGVLSGFFPLWFCPVSS